MKKLITVLLCTTPVLVPFAARPQAVKGQSELSVSYGAGSIYYLVANGQTSAQENSSGVGLINYRYYLSNRVTIGLGVGIESVSGNGENGNGNFLTVAPEMTFAYLNRKFSKSNGSIRLYSGIAWGVFEQSPTNTSEAISGSSWWPFGIQLTGFGIRLGGAIGGFAEFGMGYKGLLNFGLSARFPTRAGNSRY